MINICGTYDEDIYCKFKKNGEKYYNERMLEEAEKRSKYCESRRKNRKKEDLDDSIDISTTYEEDMNDISKTYVPHMENRNENINEDIDIDKKGVVGGKTKTEKVVSSDSYSRMVDSWFKFFEDEFGLRPKFSAMDGRKIKSIRDYLARQIPEHGDQGQEKLIEVWELILSSVPKHEFIHKNPSLNLIESKLNELMILVKSPRNRSDQHDQSTARALRILQERNKKNILNNEYRELEGGAISEVN